MSSRANLVELKDLAEAVENNGYKVVNQIVSLLQNGHPTFCRRTIHFGQISILRLSQQRVGTDPLILAPRSAESELLNFSWNSTRISTWVSAERFTACQESGSPSY